jgi:hypothetical protein
MKTPLLNWLRASLRARSPRRLLELGTGRGWAAHALAEDGHSVEIRDRAEGPAKGFDCVVGWKILRHEPDWQRLFECVARVLRPGGLFVALEEPFRGVFTSSRQRLQGGTGDRLARWQAVQAPEHCTPFRLNEITRTVSYALNVAQEAGFRASILPLAAALSRSLETFDRESSRNATPAWLDDLAAAYALDPARLRSRTHVLGPKFTPLLLAHWAMLGNVDAVVVARKQEVQRPGRFPAFSDPERLRLLDSFFLADAPKGYLPVYGFLGGTADAPWLLPEAGLIVPASPAVELTVSGPTPRWLRGPVEVEVLVENDPHPVFRFTVRPAHPTRVSIPLPMPGSYHSVLIRLKAVSGVHLGPLRAALCGAGAFRSCRLHSVRSISAQARRDKETLSLNREGLSCLANSL